MRPLIAGNWKMHGLRADLAEIKSIAAAAAEQQLDVDILVFPPATLIAEAARISGGRVAIGGQDCHAEVSGHHTGDISAEMLRDGGASAVITGHSERRRDHGETNALVAAKASAARRAGLLAIVCLGESESQRADGDAYSAAPRSSRAFPPG
jgi:triosephosphate isomerase